MFCVPNALALVTSFLFFFPLLMPECRVEADTVAGFPGGIGSDLMECSLTEQVLLVLAVLARVLFCVCIRAEAR